MSNYAAERASSLDTVDHYAGVERANDEAAVIAAGYRALAQPQDYPPGLLAQAKHAVASAAAAKDAYQAKERQARADIGQMELTGAEATYHIKLTCGAAWRALTVAERASKPALVALGTAVQEIARARATINGIAERTRRLDAQYQSDQATIEKDRLIAMAVLSQLGLS